MATKSSYAFGSIIDIYHYDSITGDSMGMGSPLGGHANGSQIIQRAQRKISSMLQSYYYNLAPNPWSPPTIYLALHQSLETLEDVLHQLTRCNIDNRLGTLGLVTHGLLDLLQEVELLLMSSRVDGPRNEKWWERFAKTMQENKNSNGEQYRQARENVQYFSWAGRLILRVSVHGEFTRRISSTGDKLDAMLMTLCNKQLGLYIWNDVIDQAQSFNIKEKFAKLALYQEKPFLAKVKFEAAIRVWMIWVNKATIGLKRIDISQTTCPSAYLNLLKASWLSTVLQGDHRLRDSSDELSAVISLVSAELLSTLKLVQEQGLPPPDLDDLLATGDWNILLQSGFEDWELERQTPLPAKKSSKIWGDDHTVLAGEYGKDITNEDDDDFAPSFRYSPVIMRDEISDDEEEYRNNSDLEIPMALDMLRGPSLPDSSSSDESSHYSIGSLYSVYSNDIMLCLDDSDPPAIRFCSVPESPDIKSMMSPAAVPQSAYEMYEPVAPSSWDEEIVTTEGVELRDESGNQAVHSTSDTETTARPTQTLTTRNNEERLESRTPVGSRFHEHFSRDLSSDYLTSPWAGNKVLVPDINLPGDEIAAECSDKTMDGPTYPQSPLAPPPPIKDPDYMLSPNGGTQAMFGAGGSRSNRLPRVPVGGTMSSAGGRSSAAPIQPRPSKSQASSGNKGGTAIPVASTISQSKSTNLYSGATSSATISLAVPGVGMAGKERSRIIPEPLQLSKKSSRHLARALKNARADIHEKGGWSSLLTPGSGPREREKRAASPGRPTGGLATSKKTGDYLNIPYTPFTPLTPLTIVSGEVVAVNKVFREPINKNIISSPTPAGNLVVPMGSLPVEPQSPAPPIAISNEKPKKRSTMKSKARTIKDTAARDTANEKGSLYDKKPGEVELLPQEFREMNAVASETGLPTGRWDECMIRIFKCNDGNFRIVTFREDTVDEEWINPTGTELVPEYAHHPYETVPILYVRKEREIVVADREQLGDNGKARRESARSSFGCIGDGLLRGTTQHIGAESFYYRFRRLDDMFHFQLALLGEMVLTDIPAVKSIRFKKGLVGGGSTDQARLQIWKEVPGFHEHGKLVRETGQFIKTRIVMYWDEVICTTMITENVDIEAQQRPYTLRLRPSRHRAGFNNSVQAKIYGEQRPATTPVLAPGQISSSTSGAVKFGGNTTGGLSEEEQFGDYKWFDIEFHGEDEMKWFYQDFMRCQKDRIRRMRTIRAPEKISEQRR